MYAPHTVTIYNIVQETDPQTFRDTQTAYITVLRGVFLEIADAASARQSGLESADSAKLYIPFSAAAVDALTGLEKHYAKPLEFNRSPDKRKLWTLSTDGVGCRTFFIKGEAVSNFDTEEQLEMSHDEVYKVTRVLVRDFGSPSMQHFEVGGN